MRTQNSSEFLDRGIVIENCYCIFTPTLSHHVLGQHVIKNPKLTGPRNPLDLKNVRWRNAVCDGTKNQTINEHFVSINNCYHFRDVSANSRVPHPDKNTRLNDIRFSILLKHRLRTFNAQKRSRIGFEYSGSF